MYVNVCLCCAGLPLYGYVSLCVCVCECICPTGSVCSVIQVMQTREWKGEQTRGDRSSSIFSLSLSDWPRSSRLHLLIDGMTLCLQAGRNNLVTRLHRGHGGTRVPQQVQREGERDKCWSLELFMNVNFIPNQKEYLISVESQSVNFITETMKICAFALSST